MSEVVSARKESGYRWDVLPDAQSLLETILASPGENVKHSAARCVTRHQLGGRTFYAKIYFHNENILEPVKYFFKNSSSRSEWRIAPLLQQLGIPVVPHLAHGELWSWRGLEKSALVTEGPAGFAPVNPNSTSTLIQTALGKFLRHLHEATVFHDDLHISNLLYSLAKNQFCLVDLDNMRILLKPLNLEQRLDNLATLNRRYPLEREFFEAYGEDFIRYKNKLGRRTDRKMRSSIPKKLKLLFHARQAFAPKTIGELKWHVRLASINEPLESILKDPDGFLKNRACILKNGTRSTVGCANGFVLKRFNPKKISTVVLDMVRASRGRRGFRTARHLELLKIATPLAIAYADRRRFGFVMRNYFIMQEIHGGAYLWERPQSRRALVVRLSELIAKTHEEGFSHRDLKETNLIIDKDDLPYLIDLDALRYMRKISDPRAAIELARLAAGFSRRVQISKKEKVIFLKNYCLQRGIENWRWWWNAIEKHLPAKSK